MHPVAQAIRDDLKKRGSPEGVAKSKRYFREPIETYGCTNADVNEVTSRYSPLLRKSLAETIMVAGQLIEGGVVEEQWAAAKLLRSVEKQMRREHFELMDAWVEHLTNWASVDTMMNHLVSVTVGRYPELADRLLQWTGSPNRWRRRSAAVTLVLQARRGEMHEEAFMIADRLMEDPEDMVQKGIGWLLKEASKKDPQRVHDYLIAWKPKTTGLVLAYASEKLPEELKVRKRS